MPGIMALNNVQMIVHLMFREMIWPLSDLIRGQEGGRGRSAGASLMVRPLVVCAYILPLEQPSRSPWTSGQGRTRARVKANPPRSGIGEGPVLVFHVKQPGAQIQAQTVFRPPLRAPGPAPLMTPAGPERWRGSARIALALRALPAYIGEHGSAAGLEPLGSARRRARSRLGSIPTVFDACRAARRPHASQASGRPVSLG